MNSCLSFSYSALWLIWAYLAKWTLAHTSYSHNHIYTVHINLINKKTSYQPTTETKKGYSVMLWGAFCCLGLGPFIPACISLFRLITFILWWTTSIVIGVDNVCIHNIQGIIEWFDKYKNDVNYMLWPLHLKSPRSNIFSPEYLLGKWCFIVPVQFLRLFVKARGRLSVCHLFSQLVA